MGRSLFVKRTKDTHPCAIPRRFCTIMCPESAVGMLENTSWKNAAIRQFHPHGTRQPMSMTLCVLGDFADTIDNESYVVDRLRD